MTTSLDDKTRALILATVPVLKKHGVTLTQEMYKRLLSESLGKEVVSAIIWSFRFGKELEV